MSNADHRSGRKGAGATLTSASRCVLLRGEGCTPLGRSEGKAYTDFVAGIAVCNLGHAHPPRGGGHRAAGQTVWCMSPIFTTPNHRWSWPSGWWNNSFADRVFFCNSGAEANEAAIKLARKYFKDNGRAPALSHHRAHGRSFHGRTMATLSATGQEKIRKGFDPVLEGFDFVPFNDVAGPEGRHRSRHGGGAARADTGRGRGQYARRGLSGQGCAVCATRPACC